MDDSWLVEKHLLPTPPNSHVGSPIVDEATDGSTLVSISTTFHPAAQLHPVPTDIVLLSSDNVFFYVHSHLLLAASENAFNNLLPPASKHQDSILSVPEHSTVLNILLHTIYDISCIHYSPSLPTITTAVNCLPIYGVLPKTHIAPSTPLYTLLISQAPLDPLEVYALAASLDLYDLAVATSSHLLSFPLSDRKSVV